MILYLPRSRPIRGGTELVKLVTDTETNQAKSPPRVINLESPPLRVTASIHPGLGLTYLGQPLSFVTMETALNGLHVKTKVRWRKEG